MPGLPDFGMTEAAVDERTQVVAPYGEVDILTAPQLGRRLLSLTDEGKTSVVVDLSLVTFIDSTGIGVLLNALRQITRRNGCLVIVCPSERTRRPFEITGLVGHLRIVNTLDEALGAVATA